MNRKTQLFYNTNEDSKFITFDNYAEALTGDILVTNAKLYPSRFLCVNLADLNKKEFIRNYLENYYENKLAFLRDNLDSAENIKNMNPLAYLIDAILAYKNGDDALKDMSELEVANDINSIFTFVGNVVEMDYNGTYTDIICTIEPSGKKKPSFILEDIDVDKQITYKYDYAAKEDDEETEEENPLILYGWRNEYNNGSETIKKYLKNNQVSEENSETQQRNLIFDDNSNQYKYLSKIKSFEFKDINNDTTDDSDTTDMIEFNMIIPLFDLQYIDEISNSGDLSSEIILDGEHNIPLGIYFCDEPVKLKKDENYSANWSLMISMQFSAFPYSFDIVKKFNDSDVIKDAYLTFAQILSKQANTLDLINKYNEMIASLKIKINALESTISNLATTSTIDELTTSMNNLNKTVDSKISEFDNRLNELKEFIDATRLKWTIKNNQ